HAIVVAAAIGGGGFVEIAEVEHGGEGVLAAGASSEDAHAGEIHPGARRRCRLHPCDAIRETAVLEILPANVVEGARTPVGAHAVDLDDDEPEFRDRARLVLA